MNAKDLKIVVEKHGRWLRGEPNGERADLCGAYLRSANLEGADLRSANLEGADLRSANLRSANLRSADLRSANLCGADLRSADLRSANLRSAYLRSANLEGADLRSANLRSAYLEGADLRSANGFRFQDAPDPLILRIRVAEHIEAHPELHDQQSWGDGTANPSCGTPCCVAGWACHFGGGDRGQGVASAAMRLLWVDGHPMPSFCGDASRESILAALRTT